VSAIFRDEGGDRVGCFIEQSSLGWRLTDDGEFLADLVGRGIDVTSGARADFLDRALRSAGASWDRSSLQVSTSVEAVLPSPSRVIRFLTALLRARDVGFWSRERVRSTFKDDAYQAIVRRFSPDAEIWQSSAVDDALAEFPADVILKPHGLSGQSITTAVFLVQAIDSLNEALMLWLEAQIRRRPDIRVAALIEDGSVNLAAPKAQRAINRIDGISIYRGDETAALEKIGRTAQIGLH
jgi:hypothetical protein